MDGHAGALAFFLAARPLAPLASREQVVAGQRCGPCGAAAGVPCAPRPVMFAAGWVFGEAMRGVHLRRYLDWTGDRR